MLRIAESHDAATPAKRGDGIQRSLNIEGQSLGTSQAGKEFVDLTAWRDAVDRVETGGCRPCNVQVIVETERHVIGGHARFERGVDEYFLVRADLENAAAAIADVQVTVVIEGNAG